MLASLAMAGLALRTGLELRRMRRARQRRAPGLRPRHLRRAKPAVAMVVVGMVGGLASWVWLRGGELLGTFHGIVGVLVAALFAAAAVLGRRLETHRSSARDAHALLGGLGLLLAALGAVAGFVLLP